MQTQPGDPKLTAKETHHINNQIGHPGTAEGIPAHSRGWKQDEFKIPPNPIHSVILFEQVILYNGKRQSC